MEQKRISTPRWRRGNWEIRTSEYSTPELAKDRSSFFHDVMGFAVHIDHSAFGTERDIGHPGAKVHRIEIKAGKLGTYVLTENGLAKDLGLSESETRKIAGEISTNENRTILKMLHEHFLKRNPDNVHPNPSINRVFRERIMHLFKGA